MVIYLIHGSKYWQVRLRMDGCRKKKSLKTEKLSVARNLAADFYNDCLLKRRQGARLVDSPNFSNVADNLFNTDQERVNRGEHSKTILNNDKSIYNGALLTFSKKMHCKDITYQQINAYIEYLNSRKDEQGKLRKAVSSKTIKNHFIVLSKILSHAVRLGQLTSKPNFPRISVEDNPRGWLTDGDYCYLLATIDQMIAAKVEVRYVPVTKELRLITTFMSNVIPRPGDLATLQHKHIQRINTRAHSQVLKVFASSKTYDHYAISLPAAVTMYSEIMILHPDKV